MPKYFISILLALLPLSHLVGGADTDPWLPALSGLIVAACLALFATSKSPSTPLVTFLGAALLVVAGLTGLTGNWYVARNEYIALWTGLCLFTAAYQIGRDPLLCRYAVKAFQLTGLVFMLIILLGGLITNSSAGGLFWQPGRLSGLFGSPNTLATLSGLYMLVSASLLSSYMQRWRKRSPARVVIISKTIENRFTSLALLVSSFACLFLTSSRTAILVSLILLAIMAFAAWRSDPGHPDRKLKGYTFAALCGGLVILAATALLAAPQFSGRLSSLDADWSDRWNAFAIYWEVWQEEWLFGHGLGSFNIVNDEIMTPANASLVYKFGAAHNLELQWLIQTGISGTVAAALLLILMIWPSAARYVSAGQVAVAPSLSRAVVFVTILVLVHGQVDYALEIPSVMWTYALLLGLGAGSASMEREAAAKMAASDTQGV